MSDWVPTPTFLYRHYLYSKLLGNISNWEEFLLIGTGNGYFINQLKEKKFAGTCIDISEESIKLSKHNVGKQKNIIIKKADLFTYIPKQKVGTVFCFEVIEHIKNDKGAFRKIRKMMKKNGKFIMSVPAHMSMWGEIDEIGGHFRRYEKKKLQSLLKKSGFEIEIFWNYGFPFLNIIRQISKSGKFVQNKSSKKLGERIKKSGVRTEYNPALKPLVTNNFVLWPLFHLMDLFLDSDLGLGYIVVAKAI